MFFDVWYQFTPLVDLDGDFVSLVEQGWIDFPLYMNQFMKQIGYPTHPS